MGKIIENTLIIGDLHEPFCLDGYLEFNLDLYKKHQCKDTILIGDIIDAHAWSYHEHDPDGLSPGNEYEAAKEKLKKKWYKAFKNAKVLRGNHDELANRKAKTHGIPKGFMKDLAEALEAPKGWSFHTSLTLRDIMVIHGSSGNAMKRAMASRMSTIQGHLHSESFVQWHVSEKDKVFGLQVGCGIDRKAYSFAYGKDFVKKPVISSGLLLNNGKLPIIELMDL